MQSTLIKLDEFKAILSHYQMHPEARELLRQTPFVALVGTTASGRDTIIKELLKTGAYYPITTDTTRAPRVNNGVPEQNGVEYFFRSEDEFLAELQAGQFIEAAIVHQKALYGVSVREVEKAHQQGKIAITDIEPAGTDVIVRTKPDTIAIFVIPPSFDIWMERLKRRNPAMTDEELQRRLTTSCRELEAALSHDYYRFVINDILPEAVQEVHTLAQTAYQGPEESKARVLAMSLLADTRSLLQRHIAEK